MAEEQADQEESSNKGNSNLKVIIIAVLAAVLLSGGMVGATIYFLKSDEAAKSETVEDGEEVAEEASEPPPPPMYHSLDPKFVVSFHDQSSARFMQFEIDVMARDKDVVDKIDEHMSAIRSSLLMLFDSQSYSEMVTKDGKLKLLNDVKDDINQTIVKMAGEDSENEYVVEAAYFTSFVIQ